MKKYLKIISLEKAKEKEKFAQERCVATPKTNNILQTL